jgi:hypothetical protein
MGFLFTNFYLPTNAINLLHPRAILKTGNTGLIGMEA